MPPQLSAALLRAALIAVPAGLLVTLGALQQGHSLQSAAVDGAIAFLTTGVARGLFEGVYDAYRAAHGLVKPSDVRSTGAAEL